jgi:hypothetical protein
MLWVHLVGAQRYLPAWTGRWACDQHLFCDSPYGKQNTAHATVTMFHGIHDRRCFARAVGHTQNRASASQPAQQMQVSEDHAHRHGTWSLLNCHKHPRLHPTCIHLSLTSLLLCSCRTRAFSSTITFAPFQAGPPWQCLASGNAQIPHSGIAVTQPPGLPMLHVTQKRCHIASHAGQLTGESELCM